MRGTTLKGGKLDGAGFAVQPGGDEAGKIMRRAAQIGMAERIDVDGVMRQFADVAPLRAVRTPSETATTRDGVCC